MALAAVYPEEHHRAENRDETLHLLIDGARRRIGEQLAAAGLQTSVHEPKSDTPG